MTQKCPETDVPEAAKKWVISGPVKVVAAALTTFGSGAALAFYFGGVGFFIVQFKSRTVLLWMLCAAYGPFPVALILQEKFDAMFDKMHSTQVTFFFRVMVVPLLMAVVLGLIALLCTVWLAVIIGGVILGFLYASTIGSSLQMTAAWEPLLVVWAQLGNTIGSSIAVVAFFIFSFEAAKASKVEFQVILLVPIAVCIITSSILMYWHFKYDMFQHVYRRLAYDLHEDDDFPPLMTLQRGSSANETVYLGEDVDSVGVPLWVPWYNFGQSLNTFMSFSILPFATYFGDADMAQTLVLAKFAMDCAGRCSALVWGYLHEDLIEPMHFEVVFQLICRLIVWIVLALGLVRIIPLHQAFFLALWCFFFWDGCHLASEIDILITRCTVVAQRKTVSRRNSFFSYAGLLIALLLSVVAVYAFRKRL